jgi:hypothetical protein
MKKTKYKAILERCDSDAALAEALETQFRELWIRVEDAMPDDDIEVLVFTEAGLMWLASHDSEANGWFESSEPHALVGTVTHWMDVFPPASNA